MNSQTKKGKRKRQNRMNGNAWNIHTITDEGIRLIATCYAIIVLAVYPLLLHNGYKDILHFKANCLFMIAIIFFVLLVGILCCKQIWLICHREWRIPKISFSIQDDIVLIFLGIITISFLFANNQKKCFWGTEGRMYGYLAVCICVFSYLLCSHFLKRVDCIIKCVVLSGGFVSLIAIINFYQIDILKIYAGGWVTSNFISTMGNLNTMAMFLSLYIPIVLFCFLVSEEKNHRIIYLCFLCVGFGAALAAGSDSIYLSLIAVFIGGFWVLCGVWKKMQRLFFAYAFFFLMHTLFGGVNLWLCDGKGMISGIGKLLVTHPIICMTCALVMLLLGVGIAFLQKHDIETGKLKVWIFAAVFILAVVGLLFVFMINLNYSRDEAIKVFGKWIHYFYFDEKWGTNRATNWIYSVQIFSHSDLLRKCFGYGPGEFLYAIQKYAGSNLYVAGQKMIDAHNVFLQYLITTGVFGCASYFLFIILVWWRGKKTEHYEVRILTTLIIVSFLAQSLVNNPHIYIEPMIFVYLGICQFLKLNNDYDFCKI